MSAKQIAFDQEAREAMRRGMSKLARGQGHPRAQGPKRHHPEIVRQPDRHQGRRDRRQAKSNSKTSTRTWAPAWSGSRQPRPPTWPATAPPPRPCSPNRSINEGLKAVVSGVNPMLMKRGMEKAVEDIVAKLKTMTIPVKGKKDLENVATIAANSDSVIGKIIAQAMDKVGKDGVITVEEAKTIETNHEFVEGMQFDRGYVSPYFVTDAETMECELEDPYILIYEKKISSIRDLAPMLEKVLNQSKAILIIAEDIEGDALAALVVNKLRNPACSSAVPSRRPATAIAARPCSKTSPSSPAARRFSRIWASSSRTSRSTDLGRCKKIKVDKDNTTIIEGPRQEGSHQGPRRDDPARTGQVDQRLRQGKAERADRQAVGRRGQDQRGRRDRERSEGKEDARRGRHARDPGRQSGRDPARRRRGPAAGQRRPEADADLSHDEEIGYNIIVRACKSPIKQIVDNAGENGNVVANKVLENKNKNWGYDARLDRLLRHGQGGHHRPGQGGAQRPAERGERLDAAPDLRRPGRRRAEGRREEVAAAAATRTCTKGLS